VSDSPPWEAEITVFRTTGQYGRDTLVRLLGNSVVNSLVAESGRFLKLEPQGTFVMSRLEVSRFGEQLRLNPQARE
jgi:hypothetical protein